MNRHDIRLAGSGGQGVILATVILAEAAVLSKKHAAQSQSYGPEARGGSCKAEVIISDEAIGFTKIQKPTFVMTLTQQSAEKYTEGLEDSCLVLADESIALPERANPVVLPILRTAREEVGKALTANIVAVGCINELLHLVPHEVLLDAVLMHVPKGTESLNVKALEAGEKLGASAQIKSTKTKSTKAAK